MEDKNQNIEVAKYFIKKTPIGHLSKCLENLKNIVGEEIMDNEEVKKEIHNYGESHLSQVPNELTNTKVVISDLTKDSEGYYYDQSQKVRFKIEGGGVENAEQIETENELRDAIDAKMNEYLEKCYETNIAKKNVYFDAENNKIVVLISAHNINLKNFWSGEWISSWQLLLNEGNKLVGNLKGNTFYYEEGNVQFKLDQNFESKIEGEDSATIAKNLVSFIEKSEDSVHLELDKVFDQFSQVYIKPLRRKMPVTGQLMKWDLNQNLIGKIQK